MFGLDLNPSRHLAFEALRVLYTCMHIYVRVNRASPCTQNKSIGEELLGESAEKDASGNKKLPAIGEFLKQKIGDYFKAQVNA